MASSEPTKRERTARRVRLATGTTAGAVGATFGASRLRDSFKEDYPQRFVRGVTAVEQKARRAGASQQQAAKVARVVSRSRPGFIPLAVATAAGATAAGAQRYEHHLERGRLRKDAFGVRRRDQAVTAAAGVGSLALARSSGTTRRVARSRLVEAGEHERRSNAEFHAAGERGKLVTQRMLRHVGGGLPRTTANLTRTGVEVGRQQAHLHAGLAARDAAYAAGRSASRGMRVSRAKLVGAGALGAAAVVHSRRH